MNLAEIIYEHVKALPSPTAQEVLNFVEFVEKRLAQSQNNGKGLPTGESSWPEIILAFEGVPEMPPFEQDRAHLLAPADDPLSREWIPDKSTRG